MTTQTQVYKSSGSFATTADRRVRTGGPRPPYNGPVQPVEPSTETSAKDYSGSHMPLDTTLHWQWNNVLNVIPAFVLLLVIISVVALIVG